MFGSEQTFCSNFSSNAFDAHQQGDTKEYEQMLSSIDVLTKAVDKALSLIPVIEDTARVLGRVKSFLGKIFGVFKQFRSILNVIDSVMEKLSFIKIM